MTIDIEVDILLWCQKERITNSSMVKLIRPFSENEYKLKSFDLFAIFLPFLVLFNIKSKSFSLYSNPVSLKVSSSRS